MKRSTETLTAFGLMLTYFAFTVWLLSLAVVQNDYDAMSLSLAPPLFYLLAVWLFDRFLAGRGINLSIYALIQLALAVGAGLLFAKCTVFLPARMGATVFHSIFYALGVVCAAFTAFEPVKPKTLSICFDVLIIMLGLDLLLGSYLDILITREVVAACLTALFVTLVALAAARLDSEGSLSSVSGDPAAGRLLIILGFAAIAVITALIAVFAFGGMQSFSDGLVGALKAGLAAVKAAFLWLWRQFDRFMQWLAELFPQDTAAAPGEVPPAMGEMDIDTSMGDAVIPSWMYIAAGGVGAAVLGWFIFAMRRLSLRSAAPARRTRARIKRESGLSQALSRLLARLRDALRYRFCCLKYRHTAAGLLAYCERQATGDERRRPDESGEKYLLRLSALGYEPELSRALAELAGAVERAFYSPAPQPVPRELYSAIHRGRFRIKQR